MKKPIFYILAFITITSNLFSQPAAILQCIPGQSISIVTLQNPSLKSVLKSSYDFFAVVSLKTLELNHFYQLALNYDNGSGIYYGLSWLDGLPYQTGFRLIGSTSTQTGKGTSQPNYEAYHFFQVHPHSTATELFLVIYSDKAWTLSLALTKITKAGLDKNKKNAYGHFTALDWTEDGRVAFKLTASSTQAKTQTTNTVYELKLGQRFTLTTAQGLTLHNSFGGPEYYYTVIRISGLKPNQKYQATLVYEGGSGIFYALSWVDGHPFQKDWRNLGGLGTGTGTGKSMPGYETYHLFQTDAKSTKDTIYLVVRSDKPWTFELLVSEANPSINELTKNSYGYFATADWTEKGKTFFLLSRD